MRIALFGPNGPTGRRLTDQALAAGHQVVAVTRRSGSVSARPGRTVAVADATDPAAGATDPAAVDAAIDGTDAVLSAPGARFSKEPITTYSASATAITRAMARHGIKRLLAVGSGTAESSADGVFTARAELAAGMLHETAERRYVRTAMGLITTAVQPNLAKLLWNEGVKKK
ncbi:NAD(P)-dependent oxidoreductase [Streptomyces sp. NPDC015125]|uniref:NAD(P)-dependent oxidoreductase n=1 Tax=Streptomyces sp. NPDC015125 TaxID=3364938 RepID=UPI0036FC716A